MRTWLHSLSALAISTSVASGVLAQERQIITVGPGGDGMQIVGPGMTPRQFKTGTGRIRGRIMSVETGAPVRRVQVRISGTDIAPKTMLTDADGRYEFRELPPGRYTVSATKAGYVSVQYGQKRPFESGKPIELADAQMLDRADIVMPRGSVIAGRIVDEFGEPVTDAMVSAMRSVWANGRRRLMASGRTSTTNDLGQFRIFGLPPGDYYVSATFRGGDAMMLEMVTASVTGGAPSAAPSSGYAATYYPGTMVASDAQKIALAMGQEMSGADFALAPVKLARVTGTVMRSDGRPADGAMVNLMPRSMDSGPIFMMERGGRTDKNGAFTIAGVAPGDYTLQTRGLQISMSGAGDNVMVTARIGALSGETEAEFGTAAVTVAGEDVSNVIVVTSKGATASGRLSFEGAAPPTSLSGIRVTAQPTDTDGPMIMMPALPGAPAPGAVQADGSFELRGLAGGRLVRVAGLPPNWILKSVRIDGHDVTDTGFDFKAGSAVSGVEVVVSNKTTDITGSVTGTDGQPVKDYTAVIFSDEPAKWTLPSTRYVTSTRPDQEGRFKVRNLPAGEYLAIAVEYLAQGEWGDPEVLERLRAKATRFTLTEGATKTLDLKLSQ